MCSVLQLVMSEMTWPRAYASIKGRTEPIRQLSSSSDPSHIVGAQASWLNPALRSIAHSLQNVSAASSDSSSGPTSLMMKVEPAGAWITIDYDSARSFKTFFEIEVCLRNVDIIVS